MKKIIYASLFLGVFASNIFAQRFPASTFPVGGFEISTLGLPPAPGNIIDSMKNIGFNTYYQADYNGKLDLASLLPASMSLYMSVNRMYPGGLLENKYVGNRFAGAGVEKRYFLASNLPGLYGGNFKFDYEQQDEYWLKSGSQSDWKTVKGDSTYNYFGTPPLFAGEWEITVDDPSTHLPWVGDILNLELDSGYFDVLWGEHESLNQFETWGNGNDAIYADFIFRFDGTPSGSQYKIIVDVTDAATTPVTTSFTFHLNGSDYSGNNRSFTNHPYFNNGFNNPISLFSFPAASSPLYAVVRINAAHDDTSGIGLHFSDFVGNHATKVVFRLQNDGATSPIYVRGFRIRSRTAEYILSNRQVTGFGNSPTTSDMKTHITNDLFSKIVGTSSDGMSQNHPNEPFKNISNIAAGGEITENVFRTFAYVDSLWADYSSGKPLGLYPTGFNPNFQKRMHIIPFLAENVSNAFPNYRAIYEDETGHPPPVIMNEQNMGATYQKKGSPGLPPFYPQDAIPNSIRGMMLRKISTGR